MENEKELCLSVKMSFLNLFLNLLYPRIEVGGSPASPV